MDEQAVIDATRRWVSFVVIGLNLCSFAGRVFVADKIRYAVSEAEDEVGLLDDLATGRRGLVVHGPTKRQVRGLVEAGRGSLLGKCSTTRLKSCSASVPSWCAIPVETNSGRRPWHQPEDE